MVKVSEVIKKFNVFVLHGLSKAGLKKELDEDITLDEQLDNINKGYNSVSSDTLCCSTLSPFNEEIGKHLLKPFGVLLKEGEIVWAHFEDLGSLPGYKSNKGIEPKEINDMSSIIDYKRESYNELHIKNPEVFGFYIHEIPTFDYTIENIQGTAKTRKLPTFFLKTNEIYQVTWGPSNFTLTKLRWENILGF